MRAHERPDLRIVRNGIQNAVQDENRHAQAGKQVEPPGGPEAPERGIPGNQQDRPAHAAAPDAQEEGGLGLDFGLRGPGRRQAGRAQGGQKFRMVAEPAGADGLAVREQAPGEGPERVAPRAGGGLAAIPPDPGARLHHAQDRHRPGKLRPDLLRRRFRRRDAPVGERVQQLRIARQAEQLHRLLAGYLPGREGLDHLRRGEQGRCPRHGQISMCGGPAGTRTRNLRLKRPSLCH